MLEILTGFLANRGILLAGIGIGGAVLNFILKRYMTQGALESIGKKFESFGYGLGVVATAGLTKWPYTSKFWNAIIEPYVILIVAQVARFIDGIVKGLQSDNPSLKD